MEKQKSAMKKGTRTVALLLALYVLVVIFYFYAGVMEVRYMEVKNFRAALVWKWWGNFLGYFVFVPLILLSFFGLSFLPKPKKKEETKEEETKEEETKEEETKEEKEEK